MDTGIDDGGGGNINININIATATVHWSKTLAAGCCPPGLGPNENVSVGCVWADPGDRGQVRQAGGGDRISDVFIAPVLVQLSTNLREVSLLKALT